MTLTLVVFYYLYWVVVAFFLLYSLFNIYHLLRFGFFTTINILIVVFYIIGAAAFLAFSFLLLQTIDWQTPLINFNP